MLSLAAVSAVRAAAIAFVQVASATPQSNQSTVTVQYSHAQAAGDTNVVAIGWSDSKATVTSVVDSRGNTYALAVGPTVIAGTASQSIYVASNIAAAAAGGNKVTVRFSRPARFADVRIAEYGGLAATQPVDAKAASAGDSASSQAGPAVTTAPNELLIGANLVQTATASAGSGYTARVITSADADILEDRIVTSTGSYSASAPLKMSGSWIMQLVSLKGRGSTSDAGGTTSPTVSITAPTQGSTLFGQTVGSAAGSSQVTLTATASDNVGVASVQFQIDGVPIGQKIVAFPYSYAWDTTTVADGPHTITAVAVDTAGNRTTSAGVTVTVSTASPVTGAAGPLVAAGASQPASNYLRASGTSTVLLLTGSHTWNDMQDQDNASGTTAFDFNSYVTFLKSHGMNATILWHKDLPTRCNWGAGGTWTMNSSTGMPWSRSGPGTASDGKPKFDLTQFNPAYFNRLAARVQQLQQNGIYAIVQLFDGLGLAANRCGTSSPSGDGYPLTGVNNVDRVSDGYTSGTSGTASMTMSAANAITNVQDLYVEHTIAVLHSFPNIIWEVSEEAPTGSSWWQKHMIDLIHSYESRTYGVQHPVLFPTLQPPANDGALFASDADVVAPHAKLSPTNDCSSGTPSCKVDFNDSDHSYFGMWTYSAQANRNYLWENFTDGAHVLFMDPYEIYWSSGSRNLCSSPNHGVCTQPSSRWNNFRDNLGYSQVYANTKLDLVKMSAQPGLSSTGYCLADDVAAGAEFLVYAPNGGAFTMNLSAQKGAKLRPEWLDPSTGAVSSGAMVTGGSSSQSFTPPWGSSHDAVLYLVDAAGHN